MSDDSTVTVKLEGIEPFARFISEAALAHAYFFAMSADEIRALPPKAKRGLMALQRAVREFGETPSSGPFDVRSAHHLDPVQYEQPSDD